ncbi:hypothetical protein [Paraburkholderia piptadeniae]|uniref:hypothetical protein n=1 Tax=Paraburkholderia piptadeniae TaxID=1701573 RepID=UPI001180960C|nr:hypothetical protein [Paraburkholderia piptadeniae]
MPALSGPAFLSMFFRVCDTSSADSASIERTSLTAHFPPSQIHFRRTFRSLRIGESHGPKVLARNVRDARSLVRFAIADA